MSRSHKHSCGCAMCKPWKYGFESKFKFSERKQLAKTIEEAMDQKEEEDLWNGRCTSDNLCATCQAYADGKFEE